MAADLRLTAVLDLVATAYNVSYAIQIAIALDITHTHRVNTHLSFLRHVLLRAFAEQY